MFKFVVLAIILNTSWGFPKIGVPRLDGKIVGGEETTIEEYPYTVSLLYLGFHICGGSIVNENTIVTAAHCTYQINATDLKIRAGSSIKNSGGIEVFVSKYVEHPDFHPVWLECDISIIKLVSPLKFDETIQPISLQDYEIGEDTFCQVTGWGRVSEGGFPQKKFHVVTVPIVNDEVCLEVYPNAIHWSMICAGYIEEEGKDACQGDSGGPLKCEGKFTGIVSWGQGCARPGYPGVYANIFTLKSFIEENL